MSRESNTAERRSAIASALVRVMAVEGYGGATIQRIAREAGLTPGLLHYHFESKAEILRVVVEDLSMRVRARIARRVAKRPTALARLDGVLEALLARGEDEDLDAVRCWAILAAESVKSEEVRALREAHVLSLIDEIAALLVAACHDDGKTGEGARAMAGALVALAEGYTTLAAATPAAIPPGSASAMAKRAMRGLVAAQPARQEER